MFVTSNHPHINLSSIPCPQEWLFLEGKNVIVKSSGFKGTLQSIQGIYTDVDLHKQGIHRIKWTNMQKNININDHVCIQTGKHANHNGWVVDIWDNMAQVMLNEDLNNERVTKSNIEVKLYHFILHTVN